MTSTSDTDIKDKFLDFGALGYSAEKIASLLAVDINRAEELINEHADAMKTGRDRFDYAVDRKLMEMAANGDFKAIDKINRARRANKTA